MEIDYIFPRRIFSSKKSAHTKILTEWKTAFRVFSTELTETNIYIWHKIEETMFADFGLFHYSSFIFKK